MTDFAHLHLHTQYSFLDGAIRVKDLVKKVAEHKMTSVAVTDHGNMYGAVDFYEQAKGAGVKPILGMEAYVTSVIGETKHTDKVRENFHLVLLAENNTGYDNLRKLSTKAFIDGKYYYPRVDKHLLNEHKEGIIAMTACLGGEVGKWTAKGEHDKARDAIRTFKGIFGPKNFFLEVQPNGIPKQNVVNAQLAQFAKDEGLELVATNDCHYVNRSEHEAQNILMAIRQQLPWGDPKLHKHETDAFYIRSGEEMHDLLKSEYMQAYENTCDIAKRCDVSLVLGKNYLPPFPIPSDAKDEPEYVTTRAVEGLERRFTEIAYKVDRDQYRARLTLELDVITKMGFSGYFLIVQDFINWSKDNGVRVGPGRGSGAGSLVAYALRITDIDPIPHNLLFERFLNPERVSMPDFDVDFMQEKRGLVIDYVTQKYGRERVGQIATYSGMNPKSAIKDVARTLGISFTEINELTKPIPALLKPADEAEKKMNPVDLALKSAPLLVQKAVSDPTYKKVLDVARTLTGLFRQAGMHAGGVVIGEKPLVEYVPLFSGNNGELVTQFDKDKVERAGLVKFDFLGLKTLDVIENAEQLVNKRIARENGFPSEQREKARRAHPHAAQTVAGAEMPKLVVELLSPEDARVFKLIASGDVAGVFQVEGTGIRDMLRKLKPTTFEDIVAGVALYRPGPMDAGMHNDFIDRKHGRQKVEYPHPLLEPVLGPTYGTFVYQEQIMQAAQVLAHYTLGGADLLRRAMGKKDAKKMAQERGKFVDGCGKNSNIPAERASEIFDIIDKFAGYGFNKSHSAAYALITYQTAYLKTFYPIEFMAALLTTEVSSTDNIVKYIHEARSHGIEVLPPNVNISENSFSVDYTQDETLRTRRKNRGTAYGRIRFGLSAVKGLGDSALEAILEARNRVGSFTSLYHFLDEVSGKVNSKILEVLTKSGAFDCWGKSRQQLHATSERALAVATTKRREKESGQTSFFDLLGGAGAANVSNETYDGDAGEWPVQERLLFEREAVGFYLSGHPLDRYLDDAKKLGAMPTVELAMAKHNSEATIVGIVAALKERKMKTGDGRWAIVTLEDTFGQAEVLCFSKVYEGAEPMLKAGQPVLVKGRALIDDVDDEGKQLTPKMRAEAVELLSEAQIKRTRFLDVNFEVPRAADAQPRDDRATRFDPEVHKPTDLADATMLVVLESLKKLCSEHPGIVPARVRFEMPGGYSVLVQGGDANRVLPSDALITAIERLRGVVSVTRT